MVVSDDGSARKRESYGPGPPVKNTGCGYLYRQFGVGPDLRLVLLGSSRTMKTRGNVPGNLYAFFVLLRAHVGTADSTCNWILGGERNAFGNNLLQCFGRLGG